MIRIHDECPICSKLRDPKTDALPYNAKVLAAMEESRAIMRGEIPAKWYKPIEEKITFSYTGTHSDLL